MGPVTETKSGWTADGGGIRAPREFASRAAAWRWLVAERARADADAARYEEIMAEMRRDAAKAA